jgi:hypothetical protein
MFQAGAGAGAILVVSETGGVGPWNDFVVMETVSARGVGALHVDLLRAPSVESRTTTRRRHMAVPKTHVTTSTDMGGAHTRRKTVERASTSIEKVRVKAEEHSEMHVMKEEELKCRPRVESPVERQALFEARLALLVERLVLRQFEERLDRNRQFLSRRGASDPQRKEDARNVVRGHTRRRSASSEECAEYATRRDTHLGCAKEPRRRVSILPLSMERFLRVIMHRCSEGSERLALGRQLVLSRAQRKRKRTRLA